jgi:hypothetical protein
MELVFGEFMAFENVITWGGSRITCWILDSVLLFIQFFKVSLTGLNQSSHIVLGRSGVVVEQRN